MRATAYVPLDLDQFHDLTLGDRQLMDEILSALIDDSSRYAALLEPAVRLEERHRIVRLARTAARACSNVGANAAATALRSVEQHAEAGEFDACRGALTTLRAEIQTLRAIAFGG